MTHTRRLDTAAIAVLSACMRHVSTAYRRELVAVSKVSCFPFLNCFASFLLDVIFLPAELCGLHGRTEYPLRKHQ